MKIGDITTKTMEIAQDVKTDATRIQIVGLLNVVMITALGGRLVNANMKRSLRLLTIRAEKVKIDVKYIVLLKEKRRAITLSFITLQLVNRFCRSWNDSI